MPKRSARSTAAALVASALAVVGLAVVSAPRADASGSVNDSSFSYSGDWRSDTSAAGEFGGDNHWTHQSGASFSYSFSGTRAVLYGERGPDLAKLGVSLDGGPERVVDSFAATKVYQQKVFGTGTLPSGRHTLTVRNTGVVSGGGHDTYAVADRIDVDTSAAPVALPGHVTKVLTIVEENHSIGQMKRGMPYLASLADDYAYARNYSAATHPSLPNYLAIAGGSTFGVQDDQGPSVHPVSGSSVFGQALDRGLTARTYAQSMPGNCTLTGNTDKGYAVKHNPWAYFVDERSDCARYDVSAASFSADARAIL